MSINRMYFGNFKGIGAPRWVELKPITIFVGPNSSGKSSCIHALACLGQTVKIANDSRPLILDDEFASVHLGRFIEVVHTKSYSDAITLGVALDEVTFAVLSDDKIRHDRGPVEAVFTFRCTKRTQEVYLESARLVIGDIEYVLRKSGGTYSLRVNGENTGPIEWQGGMLLDTDQLYTRPDFPKYFPLVALQRELLADLQNVLYLGPFRQSPLRRYATRGASPTEVGAMGEATITMLANEVVQTRSRKHINQVAKWLKELGLAETLNVARVATSDLFDVSMQLPDGGAFPIADLGYGLSQVLPVLTQCSFAPENATLLFEQPELHLHAIPARQLASVFIEAALTKNARILIETHSPELFMQFVRAMRDGALSIDHFVAYRVQRSDAETRIAEIQVDPETFDVYERWERGISVPE